jgi:hypothetical protein
MRLWSHTQSPGTKGFWGCRNSRQATLKMTRMGYSNRGSTWALLRGVSCDVVTERMVLRGLRSVRHVDEEFEIHL